LKSNRRYGVEGVKRVYTQTNSVGFELKAVWRGMRPRAPFDKPGASDNIGAMEAQDDPKSRKSASARIAQILDVADRLVVEAGALPISMKKVGDLMGPAGPWSMPISPIPIAWPRRFSTAT
jgi:hypothetical protein